MNNSPGVDTCEKPVWVRLEWISINARPILSGLNFVPLAFLLHACLLNAGLEYLRSDLVLEQFRLRNNFIFGILY